MVTIPLYLSQQRSPTRLTKPLPEKAEEDQNDDLSGACNIPAKPSRCWPDPLAGCCIPEWRGEPAPSKRFGMKLRPIKN
ncbi:Hypothetical predicted protein [Podarcis lilfordi]|uniref:Uncharacterized protein n=1 Tax=Podarcis lilfordi TaxID=74358 RepID=A0AA35PKC0_9SAUR|nr:Hypothetical predicted protein [Podarcis lilfordi]